MQSSPPTRAFPPNSPIGSDDDYELDLDALGSDTGASLLEQRVDRIFSEDIDGPSDFTQNMNTYMGAGGSSTDFQRQVQRLEAELRKARSEHDREVHRLKEQVDAAEIRSKELSEQLSSMTKHAREQERELEVQKLHDEDARRNQGLEVERVKEDARRVQDLADMKHEELFEQLSSMTKHAREQEREQEVQKLRDEDARRIQGLEVERVKEDARRDQALADMKHEELSEQLSSVTKRLRDQEKELKAAASIERSLAATTQRQLSEQLSDMTQRLQDREEELKAAARRERSVAATKQGELLEQLSDMTKRLQDQEKALKAARRERSLVATKQKELSNHLSDLTEQIRDQEKDRRAMVTAAGEAAKERELMEKTLLHLWGQLDFGKEKPQRYRYTSSGKA